MTAYVDFVSLKFCFYVSWLLCHPKDAQLHIWFHDSPLPLQGTKMSDCVTQDSYVVLYLFEGIIALNDFVYSSSCLFNSVWPHSMILLYSTSFKELNVLLHLCYMIMWFKLIKLFSLKE